MNTSGLLRPVLLALASLALVACSRDEPAPAAEKTSFSSPSAPAGSIPTYDYVETVPGRPGGTLRLSVAADPLVLDNQISFTGQWWGRLFGDYLVYLDEKGEPTPWLAKSWEVSPDGLAYTFHLREDVTFSDGEKFNAEAVRANFDRIRDPATRSALATALLEPYVKGEVLDEFTFRARLREPFGPFLQVLATVYFPMYSPKAIRENPQGLLVSPVSTGPFVVESYRRNEGITLVRRPDYAWAPPLSRHSGPAYLERIEIDFVPDPLVRHLALLNGQHDFSLNAPTQNAPEIRADKRLVFRNVILPGIPFRSPFFNTEKAPFDDVRVRKAFALAVDRDGICRITGFGEFIPKADFLSGTARYYDPAFKDVLRFDPDAANRLLDEAGWTGRDAEGFRTKDGKRLAATIVLTPSQNVTIAVSIQSDVKRIGFDLELKKIPENQLQSLLQNNDYQATGGGLAYNGHTPDVLYIRYHSSHINTGAFIGRNHARLRDSLLDELLEKGRRSSDPDVLRDVYSRAQQRLVELVPAVPLYEPLFSIAYRADVKGVLHDTSNQHPVFSSIWLDR
jgi:peptide/nickel transport system substrate-binding protein